VPARLGHRDLLAAIESTGQRKLFQRQFDSTSMSLGLRQLAIAVFVVE
jgi:hypothetical protein